MFSRMSVGAVAAMLVAGLVAPVGAPAVAAEMRPFTGRASGEVTFVPSESCPLGLRTVTEAVGQARHLGRMSLSSGHCAAFGPFGPGTMTLTAANGDRVLLEYVGFGPMPEGVYEVQVDGKVVGGTGRFEGAAGEVDMTLHVQFQGYDDLSWPTTLEWTGSISY